MGNGNQKKKKNKVNKDKDNLTQAGQSKADMMKKKKVDVDSYIRQDDKGKPTMVRFHKRKKPEKNKKKKNDG